MEDNPAPALGCSPREARVRGGAHQNVWALSSPHCIFLEGGARAPPSIIFWQRASAALHNLLPALARCFHRYSGRASRVCSMFLDMRITIMNSTNTVATMTRVTVNMRAQLISDRKANRVTKIAGTMFTTMVMRE